MPRKYEVSACPIHGTENMRHDRCLVVTERGGTGRISYCHEQATVTAVDLRDVEPLVEAARAWMTERRQFEKNGVPLPARLPDDATDRLIAALKAFEEDSDG